MLRFWRDQKVAAVLRGQRKQPCQEPELVGDGIVRRRSGFDDQNVMAGTVARELDPRRDRQIDIVDDLHGRAGKRLRLAQQLLYDWIHRAHRWSGPRYSQIA